MNYFLFLDESGDHGLNKIDPNFPIFVLCGCLLSEDSYSNFVAQLTELKERYWNNAKVILHSRDIRKCEKEFSILLNNEVKAAFYADLNKIITETEFTVIAAAIDKLEHQKKYGLLADNVYKMSLSFIIERTVFWLDSQPGSNKRLYIGIERRGAKEDKELKSHFQKVLQVGTYYVQASRMLEYRFSIHFRFKADDVSGLQLSDLVAYPIARHVLDKERANPAFDLLKPKIYRRGEQVFGLKVFP
jgi:hypothetical protein